MSKLFKLKEWVTIPEAAKHLSGFFLEEVTESDIYGLALDSQITLSIVFLNRQSAKKVINMSHLWGEYKSRTSERGCLVSSCYFAVLPLRGVSDILGVYDLPLIGAERIAIEQAHADLLPKFQPNYRPIINQLESENLDTGTFVKDSQGDLHCLIDWGKFELIEGKYSRSTGDAKNQTIIEHPIMNHLPSDSVLCMRTLEISRFVESVQTENISEKPLHTKERDKISTIILSLAKLADLDISKHSKAAGIISDEAVNLDLSISQNTVSKYLKAARELIHPPEE